MKTEDRGSFGVGEIRSESHRRCSGRGTVRPPVPPPGLENETVGVEEAWRQGKVVDEGNLIALLCDIFNFKVEKPTKEVKNALYFP